MHTCTHYTHTRTHTHAHTHTHMHTHAHTHTHTVAALPSRPEDAGYFVHWKNVLPASAYGHIHRPRDRQTDRQADRKTDRQTDRQTTQATPDIMEHFSLPPLPPVSNHLSSQVVVLSYPLGQFSCLCFKRSCVGGILKWGLGVGLGRADTQYKVIVYCHHRTHSHTGMHIHTHTHTHTHTCTHTPHPSHACPCVTHPCCSVLLFRVPPVKRSEVLLERCHSFAQLTG